MARRCTVAAPVWARSSSRLSAVLVILALLLSAPAIAATQPPLRLPRVAAASSTPSSASATSLDSTTDVTVTSSVRNGSFTDAGGLYYAEEDVVLTNTVNLNALTVVVTVQKSDGEAFAGQSVASTSPLTLTLTQSDNGSQIVYTYTLAPGQRVRAGTTLTLASQIKGTGQYHVFAADAFTGSALSVLGTTTTFSGSFTPPAGLPPPPSGPPVAVAATVDTSSNQYYGQDDVTINNRVALTALAITITVDTADKAVYDGQFSTTSPQLASSHSAGGDRLVYVFTFGPVPSTNALANGSGMAVAQFSLTGNVPHAFTNDSYEVSYTTSDGASTVVSGSFPPEPPSTVGNDFFAASAGGVDTGSPFYLNDVLSFTNTVGLTTLTVVVTVQKTSGVSFAALNNSYAAGTLAMSHADTGSAIVYTYSLAAGQTLPPGSGVLQAQFTNASGLGRPLGDTFAITATSGVGIRVAGGDFPPGLPLANTPTATSTSIPPAATATGTPALPPARATPIPPTATSLPAPANTPVPPTPASTPLPLAATATSTPMTAGVTPPASAQGARTSTPISVTAPLSQATPPVGSVGTRRPARSRGSSVHTTPSCVVARLLLYQPAATHVGPRGDRRIVTLLGGRRADHAGVTSRMALTFDDGDGTRFQARVAGAVVCGSHLLLSLHGTALSGDGRRGHRRVSLRGATFTLFVRWSRVTRRGRTIDLYSLSARIPRLRYNHTFAQLRGTITLAPLTARPGRCNASLYPCEEAPRGANGAMKARKRDVTSTCRHGATHLCKRIGS